MSTEQNTPEIDLEHLRLIVEDSTPEESELLLIPFRKDCWLSLIDSAQQRNAARAEAQDFRIKLIEANSTIAHRELDIMALRAEATEAKATIDTWVTSDKRFAELTALRTEVATRDATIDAAAAACANDLQLTSAKGIIATHMRTLGSTQVDYGAAIEVAREILLTRFSMPRDSRYDETADVILRALVATVTNSQQKGGDEPCAQTHAEDAAGSTEHTTTTADLPVSASNAAPTSDPEGAADLGAAEQIVRELETAHPTEYPNMKGPNVKFPPSDPEGAATTDFQGRVLPWLLACFGEEITNDRTERNHRFVEEALELAQSCGCTANEAHQLVDYVFSRPTGDKEQEVGGVMVTLAALCLPHGINMHDCGEVELTRIWTKVDKIREKQAAKPKHSPLPVATPLPSVTEAAKEILEGITPITSDEAMIHEIESILSRFLGAREHELRELRAECERLRKDKVAMDWIVAHVEYIVLCANTLPLSFREKWDSRIVTRESIYAAMQPSETKERL